MKTFFWDFFGPRAEPTAQHFLKHLNDFLVRNGCVGCTTGLSSEGEAHRAVWCRAAPEFDASIQRSLKPKRVEPA